MYRSCAIVAAAGVFLGQLFMQPAPAGAQPLQPPSIDEGARIFVTKCHPAHGELTEADFQQLAEAGFTVAVNKWKKDFSQYASRAGAAGLVAMRWNMGLVDSAHEDDRTITRVGKPTRYTRPDSEQAWQKLTETILREAELSLTQKNVQASLLDFEIYDRAKTDGFCESYDDVTFTGFFAALGRDVPSPLPAPEERHKWLHRHSMLQLYIGYQIDQVAKRARQLRRAIDAVNPRFQIGIYGWGVLVPPMIHGLATPEAPVLVLDAMTYGRSIYSNAFENGYDADRPDREGLKWSLTTVGKRKAAVANRYDNVIFLAGHYPQAVGPADGTQFKFTARQAFNSAAFGQGYWIWTDWMTPEPWQDRRQWFDAMMDYFKLANGAIDAGDWTWAAREPEAITTPNATAVHLLITSDGQTTRQWQPRTGKEVFAQTPAADQLQAKPQTTYQDWTLRIAGSAVEAVDSQGQVIKRYPAGHRLTAIAIGDVDGLPGDELVTLSAGWVKVWDIDTQVTLSKFYVGQSQRTLAVGSPAVE